MATKPRGILKPAKPRGILKGAHSNSNSVPSRLTEQQFRKEKNPVVIVQYEFDQSAVIHVIHPRKTSRAPPKRRVKFSNPEVTLEVYPEPPELELERYSNLNSDDESTQSAPPTTNDLDSSFIIHNSYAGYPWSPILPHRSNFILPEPNVVPFRSTSNPNREYPPHPPFVPPSPSPQNNILGLNFTTEPFTPQRKTRHHPANLPSTTYYRELDHYDANEPEPIPFDESETQTTHFQSQRSLHEHGRTASWVTASRNRNHNPDSAPKKPTDFEFIASMAHQRQRQTHGASSSGGASTSSGSLALLGSPVPASSSIFSSLSELSFLSPDPVVEFPPTPVFRDEVPEGLFLRKGESASAPGLNLESSYSHPRRQRDSRLHPSGSNYLS